MLDTTVARYVDCAHGCNSRSVEQAIPPLVHILYRKVHVVALASMSDPLAEVKVGKRTGQDGSHTSYHQQQSRIANQKNPKKKTTKSLPKLWSEKKKPKNAAENALKIPTCETDRAYASATVSLLEQATASAIVSRPNTRDYS